LHSLARGRADPRQDLALAGGHLLNVHELFDQRLEPRVVEIELEPQGAQRDAPLLLEKALRAPDDVEEAQLG
jgi:hypothetical protein